MDSKEIEKRRLTLDDHMHLTKDGVEFWYAREVMGVFGYTQWRRFEETIKRAMISLESSKTPVRDHFADIGKMVPLGSGAERLVKDYMLTRYACYLIAQNGDPRKEEIAFAQSYFALQTRKQELIEQRMLELRRLTERDALTESEKVLAAIPFERGVDQRGFATMAAKNLANSMTSYNTEANDFLTSVISSKWHAPRLSFRAKARSAGVEKSPDNLSADTRDVPQPPAAAKFVAQQNVENGV